jgi:hypothetical protein
VQQSFTEMDSAVTTGVDADPAEKKADEAAKPTPSSDPAVCP